MINGASVDLLIVVFVVVVGMSHSYAWDIMQGYHIVLIVFVFVVFVVFVVEFLVLVHFLVVILVIKFHVLVAGVAILRAVFGIGSQLSANDEANDTRPDFRQQHWHRPGVADTRLLGVCT